jgi:RHS repeat-associated protein
MSAQIEQPAEPRYIVRDTEIYEDEFFVIDTSFPQHKNYEFYADDSIILKAGFSRLSVASVPPAYFYTKLFTGGLGVYPPSQGQQGGPESGNKGYVGTLGGTIDVSATGGAAYSIPIEVPSGINGMQPELALVYNSQGGNGLAGWKWELAGLSSITRTGRTLYHDGIKGGVTFSDNSDRFLLDGQRLIKVHDYTDSIEYKTEQDGMARIRAYMENNSSGSGRHIKKFKVWQPDGTILEYGYTEDSRIDPQNGGEKALCWLLNKVLDRNGNAINYHYLELQETGEFYIQSIEYTANERLSIKPLFTINFCFLDRNDYEYYYVAGNLVQRKKILKTISVAKQETELLRYTLNYSPAASIAATGYCGNMTYNKLTSIEFEKDGMAINPTQIIWEWNEKTEYHYDGTNIQLDTTYLNNFIFVGDFNADGFSDVITVPYKNGATYDNPVDMNVLLNTGNSTFQYNQNLSMNSANGQALPTNLEWIHVFDINDDGFDDIILYYSNANRSSFMLYLNQEGQRFVPVWSGPITITSKLYFAFGDFLGEGKSSSIVFLHHYFGDVHSLEPFLYIHCDGGVCSYNTISNPVPRITYDVETGDFDGDGHTEILMVNDGNTILCQIVKEGDNLVFNQIRSCPEIVYVPELNLFPGDYNGDGKDDLLCYGKAVGSEDLSWFFLISSGTDFKFNKTAAFRNYGFAPHEKLFTYSLEKVEDNYGFSLFPSDFDGDGLCDIAISQNNLHDCSVSILSKFVNSKKLIGNTGYPIYAPSYEVSLNHLSQANVRGVVSRSQYMHVGNFYGKDNMALLGNEVIAKASRKKPMLCSLYSQNEYNSVTGIIDGLGNRTSLSYSYPAEVGVAQTDLGNDIVCITPPIRVLKTASTYKINNARISSNYLFAQMAFHKKGHGYLGFLQQEIVNKTNGHNVNKHATTYELTTMGDYAFSLPKTEIAYISNDGTNWLKSMKREYEFRCIVSSRGQKIVKPAMTRQTCVYYNTDNPSSPDECLKKEIVEYDYSIEADNTYSNAYNCTEMRTGTDARNLDDFSSCEFRTTESYNFFPDNTAPWVINRLHKKTVIQSRTGKPDVNHCWWYEYTSPNPFQLTRVYDIPYLNNNQDPLMTQTDYEYYEDGNLKIKTTKAPHAQQGEKAKSVIYEYGPGEGSENHHRLVTKETVCSENLTYQTKYKYDDFDNVDTLIASNGLITAYKSDGLGNVKKTINADETQSCSAWRWAEGYEYAPKEALYFNWSRSSDCPKKLVFYHKSGAELRSVSFDLHNEPIFVDKTYDTKGRLHSVSNPYKDGDAQQWTYYDYDNLDRLISTTTPDGTTTSITYQGKQTKTTVTPTNGIAQTSVTTVNAKGWTIRNDDASGNSYVTYDHFADGLLATATVNEDDVTTITATYDNARNRKTLTDPNYGILTTTYNAYGELRKRVSPKELEAQKETTYKYDGLGRLIKETNGLENTTTVYVYDEEESVLKGTLKHVYHNINDGAAIQHISYKYDELCRLKKTIEIRPTGEYQTITNYDEFSRVSQTVFPTGVVVNYGYMYGYLQTIYDSDYNPLWHTDDVNANGQLLDATLGDTFTTHRAYHPEMHYIDSIVTSNNLQNLSYIYDDFGNLASRKDNLRDLEETFHYDKMNRLTDIYLGETHSHIEYDPFGRMTDKQADGQTVFRHAGFAATPEQPARPHAMKNAETVEGVFPTTSQTITYTGFDKVKTINEGNSSLVYTYGYDQQRIHVSEATDDRTISKDYVGGVCEYITEYDEAENVTEKTLTYIVGPYGVFAVVEKQDGEESVHFILKDHLGSWTTITDAEGNAEQELSFDAWGCFRDPETWTQWETPHTVTPMFDRGYTGHEHMTAFGLINMNGRCYDPLTSHFLSVDAYVQDPTNAQAFNRYAYCAYNPLRYTDPTGWSYCTGPGNGVNPNLNTGGSTMYHCDDPNDMLWGKTVHPCSSGEINGINYSSSGYTIGNGCVIGNVPPSHLRAIRAWQNNPCKETSQALEDLGITVNVGCIYGSVNDVEGFRASIYSWTDGAGQSYNAQVLDYVGGNENSWYSMTNRTPDSYGNENTRIATGLLNSFGLYSSIEADLSYNEVLGYWRGKNGQFNNMRFNGNTYTGGKFKYAKAISERFRRASGILNAAGLLVSMGQFYSAESIDDKIKYGADIVFGAVGFLPGGAYISAFWFFGGRELVFKYGYSIGELMKDGINPGYPVYQPFK